MDRVSQMARRRQGKSFRKRLGVFNYKVTSYTYTNHKKAGVIPLETRVKLMEVIFDFFLKILLFVTQQNR